MARLQIYYDGHCHLCSREIEHYRKRAIPGDVDFIDIASQSFDAIREGFDPKRVQLHLHARLDGQLYIGVDAFLAIWKVIPGYNWANKFVGFPGIYHLTRIAYSIFARIRPMLPKRRNCVDGSCQVAEKSV